MVRRALTRQTRWYQNRCSTFKIKDFIVQKSFWKILEFWPLVTSILTWAKKWPKLFRNDFSRAFERRFPFCSTMRRSRDRRGGVQTPPPPPAGRGKSRGPAGRGLSHQTPLSTAQEALEELLQIASCYLSGPFAQGPQVVWGEHGPVCPLPPCVRPWLHKQTFHPSWRSITG